MHEVKINIVGSEILERGIESWTNRFGGVSIVPEFGREEDIGAWDGRGDGGEGGGNGGFSAVAGCVSCMF